ncbi:MAG: phenylalanine--tRNA ligase subunit beta [Halobacteria archaeon]
MAVVNVDPDELRRLVGREMSRDEIKEELFGLGVEYEGESADGEMKFEVVPDRPDRLSVEGLARSLRLQLGLESGVYVPDVQPSDYTIEVDPSVEDVRPYITGAVVENVNLSGDTLDSIIQLQEKLHATLGRRRNKGAIGVHDLTMLKGKKIRYRAIEPGEDTFVPLAIGSEAEGSALEEMTPEEVMERHPVGSDYADILEGMERVPAIYDAIGLFSFPPVINSKRTEVTENTRDLFIEMTGTDQWTVDKMLNVLIYTLDSRGCDIKRVDVKYPGRTEPKPDLFTKVKAVKHGRIEDVLGVELDEKEVRELVGRAGLDVENVRGCPDDGEGDLEYDVRVPPYRTDVMHPLDVVDDVGRAYGFNSLEPRYPDVSTVGGLSTETRLEDAVRGQLVGLGFQDLLNFVLTDPSTNYRDMRLEEGRGDVVEAVGGGEDAEDVMSGEDEGYGSSVNQAGGVHIENPYSEEFSMMRSWLTPSLVEVLSNNTHREYPQKLSEVGVCATKSEDENTGVSEDVHAAAVVCGADAGYENVKSTLSSLVGDFDSTLETPATEHPSYIPGRVADVVIDGETCGVIGEIHPEVLAENEVRLPAAGFEFGIEELR